MASITPMAAAAPIAQTQRPALALAAHRRPAAAAAALPRGLAPRLPHAPVRAAAAAAAVPEEEIDTLTGEVIVNSAGGIEPSESLTTDGLTWRYRAARAAAGAPPRLPVLLLHGLGSCSYAFRNTMRLLSRDGHDAFAPDFAWTKGAPIGGPEEYAAGLDAFVAASPLAGRRFAVVTHGFVLGQYGMLYAAGRQAPAGGVDRLVVLPTPLVAADKMRPELAAYRSPLPFLRPKPGAPFDAARFAAAGGPYALQARDADAYQAPFDADAAAAAALAAAAAGADHAGLLRRVDAAFDYGAWTRPGLLLFGGADSLLDGLRSPLAWLEDKPTCLRVATGLAVKVGHAPHEDFPEGIHEALVSFLREEQSES